MSGFCGLSFADSCYDDCLNANGEPGGSVPPRGAGERHRLVTFRGGVRVNESAALPHGQAHFPLFAQSFSEYCVPEQMKRAPVIH